MYNPTREQIKNIKSNQGYQYVPIRKEILSDFTSPIEVVRILKKNDTECFLLESMESHEHRGRYTFIGCQPEKHITCKKKRVMVDGKEIAVESPKAYIRELLEAYKSPKLEDMPPFTGGLVGYFAYDYIQYKEPVLSFTNPSLEGIYDFDLLLFKEVICFDHYKQTISIIVNIKMTDLDTQYTLGTKRMEEIERVLKEKQQESIPSLHLGGEVQELYAKDKYCQMVETIKNHIVEGDVFQTVISNCFSLPATGSLFDMYRVLRTTNPSPYMFYIATKEMELAGASPETLVKVEDGNVYTYPLAGTRPRGSTPEEDQQLRESLLNDHKELAEHNMLVDLGRNDVGSISEIGSVKVENYLDVVNFSHVMHIGSTVSGKIRKEVDPIDAIDAILPAGTLSGAPKIRAMEVIESLETTSRGIYGGAVGYLDFTGNIDLCIGIRLAYKVADQVYLHAGAGIVKDSDPSSEYEECKHKARAVLEALYKADGGL